MTTKDKELVKAGGGEVALPDDLEQMLAENAGQGLSFRAEDNLVPMVKLLQAQSPEAMRRNPDYVEGAEPGDILLKNSGLPPVKSDVGFVFQPSHFYVAYVEWRPNREGFAGQHNTMPKDAVEKPDPMDPEGAKKWYMPNGNIIQETRYHIGHILENGMAMPYVVTMTGSGHTVSKAWMSRMTNRRRPPSDQPVASWYYTYRLKSKPTSNKKGDWMIWEVLDEGNITTAAEFARGKALHDAFVKGEKQVDESGFDTDGSGQQGGHDQAM